MNRPKVPAETMWMVVRYKSGIHRFQRLRAGFNFPRGTWRVEYVGHGGLFYDPSWARAIAEALNAYASAEADRLASMYCRRANLLAFRVAEEKAGTVREYAGRPASAL